MIKSMTMREKFNWKTLKNVFKLYSMNFTTLYKISLKYMKLDQQLGQVFVKQFNGITSDHRVHSNI